MTAPDASAGAIAPDGSTVYVVSGGDLVAAFADLDAANLQATVMIGANLDVQQHRLSREQWRVLRAELAVHHPGVTVVDTLDGDRS